jgi:DNA-binding HxlR family transcriptional regulator
LIVAAIDKLVGESTLTQLKQTCPGISQDMIRRVLREQQATGVIECQGHGPAARWRKKG